MLLYGSLALLLMSVTTIHALLIDPTDNQFVQGDAGTPTLTAAMIATVAQVGDTTGITLDIAVRETDDLFLYTDGKFTGDLVHYQACELLDSYEYEVNGLRIPVSPAVTMERYNTAIPIGTDIDKRTFFTSITGIDGTIDTPPTGPAQAGGVIIDGGVIYVTIRCHRRIGYDYEYDGILVLGFPVADAVDRTIEAPVLSVGPIPIIGVTRFWDVSFKGYVVKGNTLAYPAVSPTDVGDANYADVADGVNLGDTIYFELVLSINAGSGMQTYWPENGVSPVGAWMHTCTLSYSYTTEFAPVPTSGIVFINDNGCSNGVGVLYTGTLNERYAQTWNEDGDAATTNDLYRSPTVVRTVMIEASRPSILGPAAVPNAVVTITCQIEYCMSFTDPNCFYIDGGALTEPACPARKKRSLADIGDPKIYADWPKEKTIQYTLHDPDADLETEVDVSAGCPEKKAFLGMTVAFGIVLLIVLAIATAMLVKIHSFSSDDSSSMEGFRNKGYN